MHCQLVCMHTEKSSTTAKALSRMNAEMMLKMGHVQTLELFTNVPKKKLLTNF
jgi:hypothetical protein